MITTTQYALLIGIPTAASILGITVRTIFHRRWMRIIREGTIRSEAQYTAAMERHKLWKKEYKPVCLQWKL